MDVSIPPPSGQRQLPVAYEFGAFRLEPREQRLIYDGKPIPLPHRAFEVLVFLVERAGHLVTKEQMLDALWPGLFVEEGNLAQNVFLLRKALTNGSSGREFIETVPRRGYRFVATVQEIFPTAASASLSPLPTDELLARPTEPRRPAAAAPVVRAPARRELVVAAVSLLLAALLLLGWFWRVRPAQRPVAGVRSIAVLPLRSLGAGATDDYLGLGLADAVTTRLGYIRSLLVRPTSSVRALDDSLKDPLAAGRALRVDAVLAGQIQKSNGRIRVTAQLIGVRDGAELWSEKLDVKAGDLFTIEDSVSEAVARALTSSLSAGERNNVGRDRPTSPEAYETYLRGRYFWNQRTAPGARKARELFQKAIVLDPGYALAYAGLADALHYFPDPDYDPRRPRELAEKALALDDTLAEAYASLGNLSLFTDWKFDEAEKCFRRALDLNPSYATAHQWYGYCFLVRGDLTGASREIRRARETDPLSPSIGVDAGLMLYYARRFAAAAAEYRGVLDLDPAFAQARQELPLALLEAGDLDSAKRECSPPSIVDPAVTASCLALVAAFTGDPSETNARLRSVRGSDRWWTEAAAALALGDRGGAMTLLEGAYKTHATSLLLIGADPLFGGLRSDPRFVDLLNRIGIRPVEAGTLAANGSSRASARLP